MKILSIGSDKKLFDENSEVRQRVIEYAKFADELHVVILNQKSKISPRSREARQENQNLGNVFLYPTNSRTRWFYVLDAYKIGEQIIKKFKNSTSAGDSGYMLISTQDPFECGLAGYFLARRNKIPLQFQIHADFLSSYFWKEAFLNKIRVLLAKFLIPRANCIRVVSQRIKKSIVSSLDFQVSMIKVLPIFVDVKKIQEAPVKIDLRKKYPQFNFIILMASRIAKEKNIPLAINAFMEIVKKYPKTGLIIVGEGPRREALKLQIANRNLQKNVILESWIDDLASYYKTADLFLLTSNYEGYGMAIVEAMASGCPVVMTDVGLAGEVLIDKKDGIVIPIEDKEKLIEAILSLIKNPDLRNDLVKNAQKTLSFWPTKRGYLNDYRDSWESCRRNERKQNS